MQASWNAPLNAGTGIVFSVTIGDALNETIQRTQNVLGVLPGLSEEVDHK